MEILLIFLEKILEAIYFSLFLIIGKDLKNKRILFTLLMIFEYLLLKSFFHFNVAFQVSYTFMTYLILKVIYKEKAQITDIFLFAAASIILIAICIFTYLTALVTYKNYFISLILNRILIFTFLYVFRKQIRNCYIKFYSLWNRRHKPKKNQKFNIKKHQCYYF